MKQLMALLLVSGLMVPLLSTEALCATSSTAPHKKASQHKRHARHAKATPAAATTSSKKAAPRPTTPEAE